MASLMDRIAAAQIPNLTDNRFRASASGAGMGGEAQSAYADALAQRTRRAGQAGVDAGYQASLENRWNVADQTRQTNQAVGIQQENLDQARKAAQYQVEDYRTAKMRQLQQAKIALAKMQAQMADTLDKARSDMAFNTEGQAWAQAGQGAAQLATMGLEQFGPQIAQGMQGLRDNMGEFGRQVQRGLDPTHGVASQPSGWQPPAFGGGDGPDYRIPVDPALNPRAWRSSPQGRRYYENRGLTAGTADRPSLGEDFTGLPFSPNNPFWMRQRALAQEVPNVDFSGF